MKHFLILSLFLALCSGAFFGFQYHKALEAEELLQAAVAAKIQEDREAVRALQDTHIDDFIAELKVALQNYKDYIKILPEIVKPKNFVSEDYARENYRLFRDEIEPAARLKADMLLSVFTRYNKKLRDTVNDSSAEIEKEFLSEWQDMHDDHLERVVDFLTYDDKLIDAYANLIEFYYVHSKLYTVDVEAEMFDFKREKDEIKHQDLLKVIQDIRRDKLTARPTE